MTNFTTNFNVNSVVFSGDFVPLNRLFFNNPGVEI